VAADGTESTVFVGMEAVRRDWTDLARDLQRQLYERLFTDQPVESYLRQVLETLRAGRHDDALVYRKRLRKHPREYTATTPPHVAAARKLLDARRERGEKNPRPPRTVEYVATVAGPEPAALVSSPLDYEHYVDKQVRPVAEPVLELLGIGFDGVAGRGEQLGLFG
jgi:DNA polymerase-2